jgi:hypothetical protein
MLWLVALCALLGVGASGARAATFATNEDARLVIGQADFTSSIQTNTQTTTPSATNVALSSQGVLAVSQLNQGRVLLFNPFPTANGAPASVVLGQPDFTSTSNGENNTPNTRLNRPFGVAFSPDGSKLLVSDLADNRVLIYNTINIQNNAAADVVIGQPDFSSYTFGTSATELGSPNGVTETAAGKLLIADGDNARVLIYNSIPTTNGAAADVVVGQPDFTTNTPGIAANKLSYANRAVVTSDGKLIIADEVSNSVRIFNTVPITNGASANVIIGQNDFTTSSNGTSTTRLTRPVSVSVSPTGQLAIADFGNNRVLIYNTVPIASGAAANVVLGQPNFASNTANNGGLSAKSLNSPFDVVFLPDGRLLTADFRNSRVLAFGNEAPVITTPAALPDGRLNQSYSFQLAATDADNDALSYSVTGGSLPAGLNLSATGLLSGTPTATGTSSFTIQVSDGQGGTDSRLFTLNVLEAQFLVVNTNLDTSTDTDNLTSLREAIAFARTFADGAVPEVKFAASVRGTITLSGTNIDISRSGTAKMTITGPGAGALALNGNNVSNIFYISSGDVTVSGLAFTNGNAVNTAPGSTGGTDRGGAINSDGGILSINDCVFTANRSAFFGGAIDAQGPLKLSGCAFTDNVSNRYEGAVFMGGGTVANPDSVVDCTFSGNSAGNTVNSDNNSGALGVYGGGATVISNCTFSNNAVIGARSYGGAIFISVGNNSTVAFTGCTFSGNSAPLGQGGVIYANGGQSVSFGNCSLSNNSALQGGGVYHTSGPVTMTGCTLNNNSAGAVDGDATSGQGGAIYGRSPLSMTNCTVSNNSAATIGGGIYLGGGNRGTTLSLNFTTVTTNRSTGASGSGGGVFIGNADTGDIARSIIAGNTAATNPDTRGAFTSGGFNVIGNVGTSTGFPADNAATPDITGTTASPVDAKLALLADNGGPRVGAPGSLTGLATHALLAGSPALDFVTTLGGVATDQRGVTRPQAARADSGAFEAQIPSIDLNGSAAGTSVTTAFTEQTPVKIAPAVTLGNMGAPTLSGASVQLSLSPDRSVETLSATVTGTDITAVYDAGTGTLSLSGRDTLAKYAQVLASVTYNNTSDTPNTSNRSVLFSITDLQTSVSATATLTVAAVNDAPVAQSAPVQTPEDTPLLITLGATDADGDPLSFEIVSGPSNGTLSSGAGAARTYTPNANFVGVDTFTFRVNDGSVNSATATITITVGGTNDAPVAVDDSAEAAFGTPITVQVLANDTDADNDALIVLNVDITNTRGTVSISADGKSVVFTPASGFSGSTSFGYTASDGTATATARVTVQVLANPTPANRAPIATADTYTVPNSGARTLQVLAPGVLQNDSDAEGNTLLAALVDSPRAASSS